MEQRSFFVSHLHDKPSGRMEVVVQEEAEDMVRRLLEKIKDYVPSKSRRDLAGLSGRIALHQFFMPATVNVIWRLSTGQKASYQMLTDCVAFDTI